MTKELNEAIQAVINAGAEAGPLPPALDDALRGLEDAVHDARIAEQEEAERVEALLEDTPAALYPGADR